MFITLFAFVLVTVYAAEEIPSYIHVCGLSDPNYDKCIVDNINNLKSKVCTGMPELNAPPTEPLNIDEIVIYNTDKLKLNLKDVKIKGYCDFVINSFYVSPDKLHFDFDVVLKHLDMNSTYDFDIHLLVSLANKGLIYISSDDVLAKISIDLKRVTKDGKTETYASKANTILNVKTFKYKFDDSEKDLVQLHEAFINTITENEKDIINKVTPVVEKAVSQLIISVINKVVHNRHEQLFPDKA